MRRFLVLLVTFIAFCSAIEENQVEPRGKKKKIALFIYFADLIVKKIFVLKIIYAIAFWVLLHKAGYFMGWLVSYLKDQKQDHHDHGHHHYDYGPPGPGPYRRRNPTNPYSGQYRDVTY